MDLVNMTNTTIKKLGESINIALAGGIFENLDLLGRSLLSF